MSASPQSDLTSSPAAADTVASSPLPGPPGGSTTLSATFAARDSAGVPPPLAARRPSSREAILDAAEVVAATDGAAHLTLDAVAERAGISKGGLLYNFSTKEALLAAMLDRHMQRFEARQRETFDALPPGPGRGLKSLLLSASGPCPQRQPSGCATLAALANNPRLLEPVRAAHRRRLEWLNADGLSAGLPFERTAIVSLAVDGLCLLEILQISPYGIEERQRIVDDLLRLVDETASAATPHP